MIVIRGAEVYDPARSLNGEVRDVWLDGECIIQAPENPEGYQVIDAAGSLLAPAGVEIHAHVAGCALNAARRFLAADPDALRLLTPPPQVAAERYLALGYTTVFDAASSPLYARLTHVDLDAMSGLDRGTYTLMGDHVLLLQAAARDDPAGLRDTLAWLLQVSGGYAVKLVNPGGGIAWKANQPAPGLDEPIGSLDLTQRRIIQKVVALVNELNLPHAVHLHAGRLGQPGNWKSFCETVEALDGQRAHLCHIQFYAYAEDGSGGYASAAEQVVHCIEPFRRITFDIGQVLFGPALAVTADTNTLNYLRRRTRRPWISRQVEGEGGNNVLPVAYLARDPASAVQWAAGLELMLRFPDPLRMFLTTDHPNGGPFSAYPQVIEWLMSRAARQEVLERIHTAAREKSGLGGIEREYSLGEIFAMTSTGPAQALGLRDRGHLGVGALADLRCYRRQADLKAMFAQPAWVMRRGRIVCRDGEVLDRAGGVTLVVRPGWDRSRTGRLQEALSGIVSIRPEDYALGTDAERPEFREVPCASGMS
jgi:formylmethanofuran dehydrogenase subunit A